MRGDHFSLRRWSLLCDVGLLQDSDHSLAPSPSTSHGLFCFSFSVAPLLHCHNVSCIFLLKKKYFRYILLLPSQGYPTIRVQIWKASPCLGARPLSGSDSNCFLNTFCSLLLLCYYSLKLLLPKY